LTTPQGVSNPVSSASQPPIRGERERMISPTRPQPLITPLRVVGQFIPRAIRIGFTITAAKGQVCGWRFSPSASACRSVRLCGPKVKQKPKVKNSFGCARGLQLRREPCGVEFKNHTRDPAGASEVKEDATYRIQLRDLFDSIHSDPRHVYRLPCAANRPIPARRPSRSLPSDQQDKPN